MTSPTNTVTELADTTAGLHMFEAARRESLALSFFPKRTNDEFRNSFGYELPTRVGNYTLWDLRGHAQDIWEHTLFPRAQDILKMNPIESRKLSQPNDRPAASLHSWMVGIDRKHAHPTMVVVSEDKNYRDEAKKLMKKKEVLKDTGFRMMALAARIDLDGGAPNSENQELFAIDDLEIAPIIGTISTKDPEDYSGHMGTNPSKAGGTVSMSEPTVCLKPTQYLGGMSISTSSASATIGGEFLANGNDYAVTVAHVFKPRTTPSATPSKGRLEFDDDGFSYESSDADRDSSSESEDSEIVTNLSDVAMEITTLGDLIDPQLKNIENYDNETETDVPHDRSVRFKATKSKSPGSTKGLGLTNPSPKTLNHTLLGDIYMVDHNVDCVLLPSQIFSRENATYNHLRRPDNPLGPLPLSISSQIPINYINAYTKSRVLDGFVDDRPLSAIKPEGSDEFIETLSVHLLDGPLLPGECGSWFIKPSSNRRMVGMVISGLGSLNLAFVLPGETLQRRIQEFVTRTATEGERFNEFGNHKSSMICDKCHSKRIKCIPSFEDTLNRCSMCLKLNLHCKFPPQSEDYLDFKGMFSVRDTMKWMPSYLRSAQKTTKECTEWGYLDPGYSAEWLLPLRFSRRNNSSALTETQPPAYLIGRNSSCDLHVQCPSVSKIHCSIFCVIIDGMATAVITNFSKNGTWVNSRLIRPQETRQLNHGDRISLGPNLELIFMEPLIRYRGFYESKYSTLSELERTPNGTTSTCFERWGWLTYTARRSNLRRGEIIKGQVIDKQSALYATLSHPNILRLREIFIEDIYVIQLHEFTEAPSLLNSMEFELKGYETGQIFCKLFSAVKYLHDRDIIHRNIKPENIFAVARVSLVKLGGFDMAIKITRDSSFDDTLDIIRPYRAPELEIPATRHRYNKATDIWSLGVVLFDYLYGPSASRTFSNLSYDEDLHYTLSYRIKAQRFQVPPHSWDLHDDLLLDLIAKMLEVDPKRRCTIEECIAHPWTPKDVATGSDNQDYTDASEGKGKQKA